MIYLAASAGVVVNTHYCGDELASWNIYAAADACGCADGANITADEETDHCCENKVVSYKVSQAQQHASQLTLAKPAVKWMPEATPPAFFIWNQPIEMAEKPVSEFPNPPPDRHGSQPLYLLHCSFTYYG